MLYPGFTTWDLSGWGLPKMNLEAADKSLNKYAKKQPLVDYVAFSKAVGFLHRHFSMCKTSLWDRDQCFGQLEPNSSPGFPLSRSFPTNGHVKNDTGLCDRLWDAAASNSFLDGCPIWSNSLKEEIRPREKLQANKIRTFTAAPLTFTLLCSRVCGAFNQTFYDYGGKTASMVGVDLYHRGWDDMFQILNKHPNAFELDESEYDSSLFRLAMYAICEFRFAQSDGSDQIRDALFVVYDHIVNSRIITADGKIVVKGTGNPSGSFNTIVDNTLVLYLLLSYAWIKLVDDNYESFSANVALLLTGDDNTFSVSDSCVYLFNATTISQEWSCVGVVTTSPCYSPSSPSCVSFLSRSFSNEFCGIKVPILCREKLIKSLIYSEYPGDVAYTIQRIGGIRNVALFDLELFSYLNFVFDYIHLKYSAVHLHDPDYQNACKGILSEDHLLSLFLCREELSNDAMPPKILIMDSQAIRSKPRSTGKNSRKRNLAAIPKTPANSRPHLDSAKVRGLIKAEMKLARRQSTGVTKCSKALLANMALPSDAKAVRVASASGSDPTALANLKARETVRFPVSATVDQPQTSHITFVYRDALRNIITTFGMQPTNTCTYTAPIVVHSGSQNGTFYPYYESPFVPTAGNVEPHGDELYLAVLGETDQFRGFICSAGTVVSVANVSLLGTIQYSVQLYKLEGKLWTFFESRVWQSAVPATFAVTETGYYAFNVVISGATPTPSADAAITGTISLFNTGAAGGAMWAQRAAPQIADFKDNIRMYNVIGCSGMYSNTASPLNRQGKILGRELPAKANFLEFLDFDTVANQSLAVVRDAPEGMFAFTRPDANNFGHSQPLLYDADDTDNDEYTFLVYPLDPFLVIHASVTTLAGQDAYFSRAISLEYSSLSMFIEQHQGQATNSDVKVALKLLSMMPQFHENPFHFDDVWDWIKNAAKDVWSAVKEVAPVAMAVAPLLL
jgi:hypothetical protein